MSIGSLLKLPMGPRLALLGRTTVMGPIVYLGNLVPVSLASVAGSVCGFKKTNLQGILLNSKVC